MIVLETERLLFRDHALEDLEPYCAMEQDAEVRRYVGGLPRTREAAEARFRASLSPVKDRLAMWATVFKPEGQYIGRCGVYPHFGHDGPVPGEGVLAFYLARAYWGQGLATEAGHAFVEFGFDQLHLTRILASVQMGNMASLRVLEKLGFHLLNTEVGEQRSFQHFELQNPSGF